MGNYKPSGNEILNKSFYFACEKVNYSEKLKEKRLFEIASQILRSGTSIAVQM